MSGVSYCNRWMRSARRPAGSLNAEEAARRFQNGEAFCAVASGDEGPTGFVLVGGGVFDVGFLDANGETRLNLVFETVKDRLFLKQAILLPGDGGSRHIVFGVDGKVSLAVADGTSKKVEVYEKLEDVSGNWRNVPRFEELVSLFNERVLAPSTFGADPG